MLTTQTVPKEINYKGQRLIGMDFHFSPFKKGHWRTFSAIDGLMENHILTMEQDKKDVMWFATSYGISFYDGNQFSHLTIDDGLLSGSVSDICRDRSGAMWISTQEEFGVSRFELGQQMQIVQQTNFTTEDGLIDNSVRSIYQDKKGIIWFGTNGGVSRYGGKQFANFTTQDGLPANNVQLIAGTKDGLIWVLTGSGPARYSPGSSG